ncbi:MAG: UPF0335 protein [Rhodothalassiaceae bacterium]|nr:MAG: UPF0335 protein [Rhodothalassiaceae bacterium]
MDGTGPQGIAAEALREYIARIERLEEEKRALQEDIREVYAQAKAHGFDPRIMRQVVRLRKKDREQRAEEEALLELYLKAVEGG